MKLFLECKPDEVLAQVAGVPPCAIVHSPGKGNVSRLLGRHPGVTGMVDEDFGSAQPRTLGRFVQVSDTHDLRTGAATLLSRSKCVARYIEFCAAGKPAAGGHDVPGPRRMI
jgi:hypothetical protein